MIEKESVRKFVLVIELVIVWVRERERYCGERERGIVSMRERGIEGVFER